MKRRFTFTVPFLMVGIILVMTSWNDKDEVSMTTCQILQSTSSILFIMAAEDVELEEGKEEEDDGVELDDLDENSVNDDDDDDGELVDAKIAAATTTSSTEEETPKEEDEEKPQQTTLSKQQQQQQQQQQQHPFVSLEFLRSLVTETSDEVEDGLFDPIQSDSSCHDASSSSSVENETTASDSFCWSPPESTVETETVEQQQQQDDDDDDDNGNDEKEKEEESGDVIQKQEDQDQQLEKQKEEEEEVQQKEEEPPPSQKDNNNNNKNKKKDSKKEKKKKNVTVDKHWGSNPSTLAMRDRLRSASLYMNDYDDYDDADEKNDNDDNASKKKGRPPVFLLPGLASTRLVSWRYKNCRKINPLLSDIKVQDYVWLNINLLLQMGTIDSTCWRQCMTLGINQTDIIQDGCKLRPDEGLDAISSLAPGGIGSNVLVGGGTNTVYAWLTQWLADNLGYDIGSVVGLGYDWRLSPDVMEGRDGFLTLMRRRVEAAVKSNGGPGIMVAHSMGNSIFRYFLEWLRNEMREESYYKYVRQAERRAKIMEQQKRRQQQKEEQQSSSPTHLSETLHSYVLPGWMGGGMNRGGAAGGNSLFLSDTFRVADLVRVGGWSGGSGETGSVVSDGEDGEDGDSEDEGGEGGKKVGEIGGGGEVSMGNRIHLLASSFVAGMDELLNKYFGLDSDEEDERNDSEEDEASGHEASEHETNDSDDGDSVGSTTQSTSKKTQSLPAPPKKVEEVHDKHAKTGKYARLWELAQIEGDATWLEWLNNHIWTYVGLSAPLLGAVNPLRAVISGENMGLPMSDDLARFMELSFGSTHTLSPISTKAGFCTENTPQSSGNSNKETLSPNLACLEEIASRIQNSKTKNKKDPYKDYPALRSLLQNRVDWDTDFPTFSIQKQTCPRNNKKATSTASTPSSSSSSTNSNKCVTKSTLHFGPHDIQNGNIFRTFSEIYKEKDDPLLTKLRQLDRSWWHTPFPNLLNTTWDRPHIKHVIMAYGVDQPTEVGYVYRKLVDEDEDDDQPKKQQQQQQQQQQQSPAFDGIPSLKSVIWEEPKGHLFQEPILGNRGSITNSILKRNRPKKRPLESNGGVGSLERSGDGSIPYLSLIWAHTWLLHSTRAEWFSKKRKIPKVQKDEVEEKEEKEEKEGEEGDIPPSPPPTDDIDDDDDNTNPLDSIQVSHRPQGKMEWIDGSPPTKKDDNKDNDAEPIDYDTGTSHPHGTKYKPAMVRFHNEGKSRTTGMEYTTTVIEARGVEHKETTRNYDILAAVFTDVLKHMHDDLGVV